MATSPCTGLCQINPATGYCQGCRRSLTEITAWSSTDEAGQQAILQAIAARQSTPQTPPQKAPQMETPQPVYVCVGLCQTDPETGTCLGCGRPPADSQNTTLPSITQTNSSPNSVDKARE